MNEELRQQIALFRFSVIGTLISGELEHGAIAKQIAVLSKRMYNIPNSNRNRIGGGTIEDWLYAYKKNGLAGLKPKARSDQGSVRDIDLLLIESILDFKSEHPRTPLRIVINKLIEQKQLPLQDIPLSTLYRYLRQHQPKRPVPVSGKVQKRFSHQFPNDLWQGDVMHGFYIKEGSAPARKTYLIAFIDDSTRLIVGAKFFYSEATVFVKEVLRDAVLTYGIPSKLYLDNGRNFLADDIAIACAAMKCALIHSTPYYPESKGKIERFFRTVRDCFLSCLNKVSSLEELNNQFSNWLTNDYNRKNHSALDGNSPLDTFLAKSPMRIRRLESHIDPAEIFCKKETRIVAKDGTFRVNSILYEAEEQLIGRKIVVLYDKDDLAKKVKVFDGECFVHTATPIDFISNAHAKRKCIETNNNNNGKDQAL
jgi:transposase InsO family protein